MLVLMQMPLFVCAQITVDTNPPNDNVTFMVNNVLLGNGITATNVTYTGASGQIGYYEDPTAGVIPGLDLGANGLVMSTGSVDMLQINGTGPLVGVPISGDSDLLDVAQSVPALIGETFNVTSINDIASLEFDFIPTSNQATFRYVFASDEWNQWINSQYNDAFGFFVSGPGLVGPFTSPVGFPDGSVNIAFVPGTTPEIPITISSITPTLNAAYYVSNSPVTGGVETDHTLQSNTTTLTAVMNVTCGETYHIRMAIGDGTDGSLDSAVFLEGGSFESPPPVGVDGESIAVGGDGSDNAYEGCAELILEITRPDHEGYQGNIVAPYTLGGTATLGADYLINGSVTFPGEVSLPTGVDVVTVAVDVLLDEVAEPDETVIFSFGAWTGGACEPNDDGSANIEVELVIIDHEPLELVLPTQLVSHCAGDEVILSAEILGGIAFPVDIPNGHLEPYFEVEWEHIGTNLVQPVYPTETSDYVIRVEDVCGDFVKDTITVVVREWDELRIVELLPDSLCSYDQGRLELLSENIIGGDGEYTYSWSTGIEGPVLEDYPGVFTVKVTDGCGQSASISSEIVDYSLPEIVFEPSGGEDPISIEFVNLTADNGDMLYVWNYGDGTKLDTIYKPETHLYPDYGQYVASLTVTNSLGCEDVISKRIVIEPPYYAPTAFTPNGDGVNEGFKVHALGTTSYSLVIYDRWGKEVFTSSNPDQEWFGFMKDGVLAEAGIYVYRVKMRIRGFAEPIFEEGSVTLLR